MSEITPTRAGRSISERVSSRHHVILAIDSLIAATAIVHRLIVVTGNVKHFQRTGAQLFNPFEQT